MTMEAAAMATAAPRQSGSIGKLALALAKAQATLPNIPKSKTAKVNSKKTGVQYSYSYADLSDVLQLARPILAAQELAVVQSTYMEGDMLLLETRLVHGSGEWLAGTYPVCRLAGHQDMGAALTYARRYAYCAMIGIAAEDDDDGQSAADPKPSSAPAPPPQKPPPPKAPSTAPPKNTGHASPPDGEPTAETLLDGIPHHLGLRTLTYRAMAALKEAKGGPREITIGGRTIYPEAHVCTVAAIDAAYAEWEAWRRALLPKMSKEDDERVLKAMESHAAKMKQLQAAWTRQQKKQAADAAAAGANADDGEMPDYEPEGAVS